MRNRCNKRKGLIIRKDIDSTRLWDMSTGTPTSESRPLSLYVGGGVERRTAYHEERAAQREALARGTARSVEPCRYEVVTVSAGSVAVHEDAPNYARPQADYESKKDVSTKRRREAAYAAWRRGDHHPDRARELVETPGSGGSAASRE